MQIFTCPWCGPRVDCEFHYGGDAGKQRPERSVSDAGWAQYRFYRANGRGVTRELWQHAGGCGRWVELERNTVTHEIMGSRPMSA